MASAIKVVVCECNKTAREEQQAVLGNFEEQIIGANVVETAFAKFGRELVSSRFPSPSVLFVSSWLPAAGCCLPPLPIAGRSSSKAAFQHLLLKMAMNLQCVFVLSDGCLLATFMAN